MNLIPRDTLEAVYRREQPYRRDWPATAAEGLQQPAILAIVQTLARHVPAVKRSNSDRGTAVSWGRRKAPMPEIDRKRLAAGEKPDDDE